MKLNLGSNDRKFAGFLSVDIVPPADIICDLNGPWPWPDNSVHEVLAYDVFEHIGDCSHVSDVWRCSICTGYRQALGTLGLMASGLDINEASMLAGRISQEECRHPKAKPHVMNELWRVLKPGARATIQTPNAAEGDGGFCDPTHQSYWTPSDFEYYTAGDPHRERFDKYYGVTARFNVVNLVNGKIPTMKHARRYGGYVVEMQIVLECVKP